MGPIRDAVVVVRVSSIVLGRGDETFGMGGREWSGGCRLLLLLL